MRSALLALVALASPATAADPVDYRKDIKPLLQERCYACHGALAQKGKLRVDSGANLLKSAVVPGKPAESELVSRITSSDDATRMPPEGHPLKPDEIARIKKWIEDGAKVPADDAPETDPRDHWSFRAVVRPAVPPGAANPIDAFISLKRKEKGLAAVPPADKRVLLRRVYIDLTGLPPTPEQTEAFLKDTSANAYEKLVDSLLASPQYGERWGRHFLDIWRYSDWWGLGAELRNSQRHIWHWRDWTIESFNADLGYDEMVRQMLAADELYPTDSAKLRATGYLARPYFLFNRTTWLDEVVEHTGKGFLGLTFNCAKCHDHKYDPFTQANYYSFRAIFEPYQLRTDLVPGEPDAAKNGIPRAFDCNLTAKTPFHIRGDERNPDPARDVEPGLPKFLAPNGFAVRAVKLPPEAHQPLRRPEIADTLRKPAEAKLSAAKEKLADAQKKFFGRGAWAQLPFRAAVAKAETELAQLNAAIADPAKAPPALRGAVKSAESNVEDGNSKARAFPDTSTGRRTALAHWIADAQNPLTARVAVNHVWLRHFGQPLVPQVFEFGRKGTPPVHRELLDWLAAEFTANKWSFKKLHKLIVTSDTYKLGSSAKGAPESAKADPENRYLWRANPQRMDANAIRDALLHLSGDLDLARGGPPVPLAQQDGSKRRALYFFHSHNEHNKLLDLFDNANVLDCYRRTESIVPQQALALWNSKLAMSAAGKLTARLEAKGKGDAEFVAAAFALVLCAEPTHAELVTCLDALVELRGAAKGTDAERATRARLQLVQALLNHNDFVTVR